MLKIREPISVKISDHLREFTTKYDRADVISKVNGVSSSTLRDLVYRGNSVSENNLPALKLLLIKACENADAKMKQASNCKRDIKKVIDCI
ncbi:MULTISPECIES: hypothetical protein [Chryseobacterium]|uniref:Uncharacterized protein n=1 Tax=Chryseobacterium antibioticum TaxID=2728847 RepID=A0A7Y0AMB6_9FLAO|nr:MULTISPECIES: hypothetical protein [Chryseobacterium]NML69982.1 hypothetical protein [Chryseobacterium antibioticum]